MLAGQQFTEGWSRDFALLPFSCGKGQSCYANDMSSRDVNGGKHVSVAMVVARAVSVVLVADSSEPLDDSA